MAFFVPLNLSDQWFYIILGFILFRLFDIFKPPPINRLQSLNGGYGVMGDDIVAGVYANLLLQLTKYLNKTIY